MDETFAPEAYRGLTLLMRAHVVMHGELAEHEQPRASRPGIFLGVAPCAEGDTGSAVGGVIAPWS